MYFMINDWIAVLINLSFWSGREALTWKRLKPQGESPAVFFAKQWWPCGVVFKGVSKCKLHPSQTKMQLLSAGAWMLLYLFVVYFDHCATSQYNGRIAWKSIVVCQSVVSVRVRFCWTSVNMLALVLPARCLVLSSPVCLQPKPPLVKAQGVMIEAILPSELRIQTL